MSGFTKTIAIVLILMGCFYLARSSAFTQVSEYQTRNVLNIEEFEDKVYIEEDDLKCSHDSFWIHTGSNIWISTSELHRDSKGLFTYTHNIARSIANPKAAAQRKWKCPYCYQYWDVGQACQNEYCPSRYKMVKQGPSGATHPQARGLNGP